MTEQPEQGAPLVNPGKAFSGLQGAAVRVTTPGRQISPQEEPQKKLPTAAELGPKEYCWGTGRRKSAVARVRIRPGNGKILVNKRELDDFFPRIQDRQDVQAPLVASDSTGKYDVLIQVHGGGITGQAGAVKLGLARALVIADPETFIALRDAGLLTRDSRMIERKKYGKKKARKSFQFSKR